MIRIFGIKSSHISAALIAALTLTFMFQGCKTGEVKKGSELKQCDTDIRSKCSGDCVDGNSPKYYFDSRNLQSVMDETDRRVAFLKRQGLGDLDDYGTILNNEKKNASFAKYSPPACSGCKSEFILKGQAVKCEEFYKYIETLNLGCGNCVEVVPDSLK